MLLEHTRRAAKGTQVSSRLSSVLGLGTDWSMAAQVPPALLCQPLSLARAPSLTRPAARLLQDVWCGQPLTSPIVLGSGRVPSGHGFWVCVGGVHAQTAHK